MTQPLPFSNAIPDDGANSLSYEACYPCPLCRQGQLSCLTLTEAFACDVCQHIFTVNLNTSSIQLIDGPRPSVWRWTGERWLNRYQTDRQLTAIVWLMALILISLPAGLIALAGFLFPPLDRPAGLGFAELWAIATGVFHTCLVFWLLAEHYQWPWYVRLQVSWGRWR